MNQSRMYKGIALTVAMSVINGSLALAPAAYAAGPEAPGQAPYYQQGQSQTAPMATAPDRMSTVGNSEAPRVRPSPTLDQMVVDGLILRPVMFLATILGTGLFVATLPASALGGNVGEAGRKMVVEPAESTFATCLGCLLERNQAKYESWH